LPALFGGIDAITSAIVAGCHEQGYTPQPACADRAGRPLAGPGSGGAVCADMESLSAALAALPCPVTRWPAEVLARLESLACAILANCGPCRAPACADASATGRWMT
jgi:protein ImuB